MARSRVACQAMGRVEAIFIAGAGAEPMRRVRDVEAVPGGLVGDRYLARAGYWTPTGDVCEVTLIEAEALDHIRASSGVTVSNGEHRRNIVTRGVTLRELAGQRFRVGEALMEYDRPRPPCRYIASITEPGMTRALGARRGGICVRVVEGGTVRVGDAVYVTSQGPSGPPERNTQGEPPRSGIRGLSRRS